jgi:hypothetical protein
MTQMIPDPPNYKAKPDIEIDPATEARLLREMEMREICGRMIHSLRQQFFDALSQRDMLIDDLMHEVAILKGTTPRDSQPVLPPVSEITKIKVQIFHNTGKGKIAWKLKLYVWTCPPDKCSKYLEGTCGDFYMHMADPNHRSHRRYNGDKLDYLNANDVKLMGALCISRSSQYDQGKHFDQAAIVMPDNHLYLDLYGKRVDLGMMRSGGSDWADDAALGLWQYPDCYG